MIEYKYKIVVVTNNSNIEVDILDSDEGLNAYMTHLVEANDIGLDEAFTIIEEVKRVKNLITGG